MYGPRASATAGSGSQPIASSHIDHGGTHDSESGMKWVADS